MEKIKVNKPTYSLSKLLEIYNYTAGESTTLDILENFTQAVVKYELILDMELVVPFEDFSLEFQQQFFTKESDFHSFSKHINPIVDSFAMEKWLLNNREQNIYKSMDYLNILSNWGIRESTNHPVILDLGYFFFNSL